MSKSDLSQQSRIKTLLENARIMLEHNEFDAAEALLHVIVKRDPQNASAHEMLNSLKLPSAQ